MHIKEELIRLIYGTSCESEFEGQPGSCPYRRYGTCGIIGKIDFCAATHLADHLIANGVTVQRWIPVTERLPEEYESALCWYEYYHWSQDKILPEYEIGYIVNGRWAGEVSTGKDCKVLAWMPLPEPPKEET